MSGPRTAAGRRLVADLNERIPETRPANRDWAAWTRALRVMVASGVALAELEAADRPAVDPSLEAIASSGKRSPKGRATK